MSFAWITFAGRYSGQSDYAQHEDTECQGQHAENRLGCQNMAAHHGTIGAAGCCPVASVHYYCRQEGPKYPQASPGEDRQAVYNVLLNDCDLGCLNHMLYACCSEPCKLICMQVLYVVLGLFPSQSGRSFVHAKHWTDVYTDAVCCTSTSFMVLLTCGFSLTIHQCMHVCIVADRGCRDNSVFQDRNFVAGHYSDNV